MKRSEMLKLIEGLYNLEINNYPKNNDHETFAENLLCTLEEKGMLPPIEPGRCEQDLNLGVPEWEEE